MTAREVFLNSLLSGPKVDAWPGELTRSPGFFVRPPGSGCRGRFPVLEYVYLAGMTPMGDCMELRRGAETVLVVDDEAMVKDLARDILKRHGYTVLTAGGGQEAVEIYRQQQGSIAVVVLDILMPGMDGREAFRRMRDIDPGALIIVSSGYGQTQDAQQLVVDGAAGFIPKPYRIAELVKAVGDVLEKQG